ncbi:MAG: MipA/OmpV family protein [Sulfuricaulis sp.]
MQPARLSSAFTLGVPQAFSRATRSTYNARAGYSGSRVTVTVSQHFSGFWVGVLARYDNLSGALFAGNPLVKKNGSLMAGIGIAWILARSKRS